MNADGVTGIDFLPTSIVENLPIAVWATDLDLHLTRFIAGPHIDCLISKSSAIITQDGQRGYDVRYPQHPDVAAHLRARAGETVIWQTGWGNSAIACATPLKGDSDEVVGVVGALVDMTALREERLRRERAERILYALLDEGGNAAALLDEDDRVIYANKEYLEAVGMPLWRVIGNSESPVVRVPPQSDRLPSEAKNRPEGGWETAEGRRFRSRRFGISQAGAGAKFHLAIETTEVDKLRSALFNSEKLCKAVMEGVGIPLIAVTLQGRVEGANEAFSRALGIPQHQIIGRCIADFVMPSDHGALAILQDSVMQATQDVVHGRLLLRREGQVILAEVKIQVPGESYGCESAIWIITSWEDPAAQLERTSAISSIIELDRKVLELLALGCSNSEIAEDLSLSRQGLDYRLKSLRKRLKADSRGALVARAYAQGLFDINSWPPRCRRTD
ncbi:PAS domain-containing protein [Streptomyces spectabilis]|uniref:PAS domain S-box-containing protein n=1 Tax=Streptomyces spectabilis TaxID=68270 RepID=A0A7W8B3B2_STRST|nr:PAS domain-containing protein [Streptomyces spectabilis]MBB5109579.1 PAS domain S-box-containing protein [Streptomyces spectabilis]